MKCIIAGGRDFNDYNKLKNFMNSLPELPTEIVSGCARGADHLGILFAEEYGLPCKHFPAEWDKHGKAAGPIRNIQMADYADILVACWDGVSRGTRHMINEARKRDLIVFIVDY